MKSQVAKHGLGKARCWVPAAGQIPSSTAICRALISRFLLFVFTVLSLAPLTLAQQEAEFPKNLYQKDVELRSDGQRRSIVLPDSLIIKDTETVWVNGRQLSKPDEYQVDYSHGIIHFRDVPPVDATIRVKYHRVPFDLRRTYKHRSLLRLPADTTGTAAMLRPKPRSRAEGEGFASDLRKSGSIVRGVTIGSNRGLTVDSGLRMQISGKVTENLEVVASLTDQNTPIQPEGNTQTLQEIDKVFVDIKGPDVKVTMGDYYLDFKETEFGRYARKLQGAMGTVELDNFQVTASGAVSRGQFYSMMFMGQEGYQGPYQLKGDRGQIDIIVLAGTERVWIDGEPMTRGENDDYVIDYSAGQITFTRHRLITADSRITVDFQYSDERFRRNIYGARGKAKLGNDKIQIGTTFLRESDDKDNPLDFSLTEERLAVLSQAGDDPMKAVMDGATYVGAGKGSYSVDSTGAYVYVGADSGSYQVSFSDVGGGEGDYTYKGGGVYEYAGKGAGRYLPVILLPTAKKHELTGLDVQFSPVRSVSVFGEASLSRYDANSYSSLDDGDNNGVAYNVGLRLRPERIQLAGANLGRAEVTARLRKVNDRFVDIDRTTVVEYNRRWDLPDGLSREELVHELSGLYAPFAGLSVQGEYGAIEKGEDFSAGRWQAQSELERKGLPKAQYRVEFIDKDNSTGGQTGTWLRQRGNASYTLWKLRPTIGYENEVKKESFEDTLKTGFRFDNYQAGLELHGLKRMGASASFSYRDDRDYTQGFFEPKSVAATQTYKWSLQDWHTLSASMEFTHRDRSYSDPEISDQKTDLADFQVSYSPFKRALATDWHYQLSNTAIAKRERVYLKVTQGDGNYRFDEELNEYVPDALGDYVLRTFTTDQFVPVVELRASTKIRFEPHLLVSGKAQRGTGTQQGFLQRALSAISSETFVRIEEKSREEDVWEIYKLNLSRFQRNETTMFGNITLREDVYLFQKNRKFSARVRYMHRKEKNNQYLEGGQDRMVREWSSRIITRVGLKVGLQLDVEDKATVRTFQSGDRQDRDVISRKGVVAVSYRPKPPLEFALKSKLASETDAAFTPATEVTFYALEPGVNYSLRGKGQFRGQIEWAQVNVNRTDRAIPYELAEGNQVGSSFRWTFAFDYRVSQNIRVSISYSGRDEPNRPDTVHIGKAEMRAFF